MDPEINLIDQDTYQRGGAPHDQFAWLRSNDPVHWHADGGDPEWPGFWAVTRHADVGHISRHPEIFSSSRRLVLFAETPESDIEMQRLMMLNMDPPQHTRQRSFVNRGFTPRMIARLAKHVREICDTLIDEVAPRGEADFVTDIAAPLPLQVICELVGAPPEDRDWIFDLSNKLVGYDDPEFRRSPEEGMQAAGEIYAYADELAARRRAQPADDIVTRLLQPDDAGEVLTSSEFDLFFLLLAVAGNETTRNAASGGMLALFQHPDQWQRLLADRDLIPTAAEEIVRWVSPVNLFRRTATCETEIGGQAISEGDKVVVFYASANRDEDVFDGPAAVRHRPRPEPARRVRRRRAALLPGQAPGRARAPGAAGRARRADAEHRARRRGQQAQVQFPERDQAHAGAIHAVGAQNLTPQA